jgi:subtilisin family serine protease
VDVVVARAEVVVDVERAERSMRRSGLSFIFSLIVVMGSLPILGFSPVLGFEQNPFEFVKKIKNWGLINSTAKSHIQAVDAWKIQEGSRRVVVAVIDTGIGAENAFSGNLWHDHEDPSVYGWNYVSNRPNPVDEHGHGTHVAGIIGALADPSSGVSGVAHRVSIMPVKYYSDINSGPVNLKNSILAIKYAVDHGARIINYSGGGPESSPEEKAIIEKARDRGVLFISAAGNEHQDTDKKEYRYYPSAYRFSNIISVAATNIQNDLLKSSNWGKNSVDVAAPGENIYSTLPNGRFGYMSGTSQATAFVTGIATLLLSQDPTLTPQQIKEIIVNSVDKLPQLEGRIASGGRVNAYRALLTLQNKNRLSAKMVSFKPSLANDSPHSLQNSMFSLDQ